MVKISIGVISIILIVGFSGCNKKWNDFQTEILNEQSKAMSVGNNKKFQKCYKDAVMSDYSGKEWMEKSSTMAMIYVSQCMK